MATKEVQVCNLALCWLGGVLITSSQSDIADVTSDTDDTKEVELCQASYDMSRDAALEARDWTFATSRVALVETSDSYPTISDLTAFDLPSDHIRTLLVSDDTEFKNRVEFYREKKYLIAAFDTLYIKYICQVSTVLEFPPTFVQVLAARLAHDICIPLTKNVALADAMWNLYERMLITAGSLDGQQGVAETVLMHPKLITAR
jgi:hypothetical protein